MKRSVRLTIQDLVRAIQDTARDDDEVVAVLAHLLNTRRVLRTAAC